MKTLEQIFDIIENYDINIAEYKENNILCGYELDTYTDAGVNEILFLDFRHEDKNPKKAWDFINEFHSYVQDYYIDDRIDIYRQDARYKNDFTLKESLNDFTKFHKKLKKILKEIKN